MNIQLIFSGYLDFKNLNSVSFLVFIIGQLSAHFNPAFCL